MLVETHYHSRFYDAFESKIAGVAVIFPASPLLLFTKHDNKSE